MFYEIKENKNNVKNNTVKNIRESHRSDWEMARPNHAKIQSVIDKFELNAETVLNDLLSYLPDDALSGFAKDMEHDYCDEE